ncbi:BPI fold-containing family B member 6 [Talpa occidentalis]|uniref:BPI fold-containing family B member 6 n=1 Tax=Talpa occidentalis TaxID=50954 RepID=UPI001890821D|nr:BPI fold-containing family B member 6 [Talpa occidentalis]
MLSILCLALCSLLTGTRADPGVLLRLGMDLMNREVQNAMDESHILEKMAAEAGKKPIKGITEVKVKDVLVPVITLNLVPGVGIFQCVSTGMTITGKSLIGGNMEIIVVLNITATDRFLKDEETGLPMFKSEGCEVIVSSVKTNLPKNMVKVVSKILDSTLHKVLPGMLCPAIDAVLAYVNKKWANLNLPMPVGQMGTVKYALTSIPTPMTSYIQVDFSPEVQQKKGNAIKLADSGEALEFPEMYAEGSSQLLLSAAFLTAELALLQTSFDVNIKKTKIGKLRSLTTATLANFIPEVSETYPKPKPLVTKIKINKPPKVTMKKGKSLMHFHGTLEMFATKRRGKAPASLFLLELHFNLKIQFSVSKNRLQMTTSMNSLRTLSRESSSIGAFSEEELSDFITDFLREAYVPVVNDVLRVGLPLPDFLNMNYNLAELDIIENALVLDLKLD